MYKILIALAIALVACTTDTSASDGWKDLGSPNGSTQVYRYCDGYVAVYVALPNSNNAAISAVVGSGSGGTGPC